jgi:hypothetical protein
MFIEKCIYRLIGKQVKNGYSGKSKEKRWEWLPF